MGGEAIWLRCGRESWLDPAADEILHEQRRRAAEIIERYRGVIEHLAPELAKTGEIDGGIVTQAVLEYGLSSRSRRPGWKIAALSRHSPRLSIAFLALYDHGGKQTPLFRSSVHREKPGESVFFSSAQPTVGILKLCPRQGAVDAPCVFDLLAGRLPQQVSKLTDQLFHGDQFLQASALPREDMDLIEGNVIGPIESKIVSEVDARRIGWIGKEAGEAFDVSLHHGFVLGLV
jgi:hypothetical protein